MDYAIICLGLGDLDAVIQNLKRSLEQRLGIINVLFHPIFQPVRDDPRFAELVQIIGIDLSDVRGFSSETESLPDALT